MHSFIILTDTSNNFGVLIDNESNRILGPAPLFDHGNSLFYNITNDEYADLMV